MDRFAELRAFVAVVDASGFAAAARDTGQSRSAVNRLVLSLEQRLGVQLLNRSTRKVSLTSAGRAFHDRALQLLDDLEEAETAVSASHEEAIGSLRISGPQSFGDWNLSALACEFMQRHPRVKIELDLDTRFVDILAEGYDLAVRIAEPDEKTNLVDHRIVGFEYMACASEDYLARHGRPAHPRDLRRHALLEYRSGTQRLPWVFSGPEGETTVSVQGVLCANNLEPLLAAAVAGLGVTVMPGFAIRGLLERGSLIQVLPEFHLARRMLQVIYPPTRHLSAKVRLFTDFLIERYGGTD